MPFKGTPITASERVPRRLRRAWNLGSEGITKNLKRAKMARRVNPFRRLKMQHEDLVLRTGDGVSLNAWFVTPDEPRGDGLMVLMHHHYLGQKASMIPWIHLFWRLGLPTLSFDARGHAASDPSPDGRGSFAKRAADVRAAWDELQRRGAMRILGYGQSQGAATLVMGVGGREALAGLILDSGPAPEMGTAAWGLAGNILGLGRRDRLARTLLAARIIPGTEPLRYMPLLWGALYRSRRTPLLWLHGDADDVIRPAWSRRWYDRLATDAWEELAVPGAEHVRTLQTDEAAVTGAVQRLLERATPSRGS